MPEEQEIPQQPLNEDAADSVVYESSISQSETQTPDMEVHHHPDLHHKKKNFKEYFLEFLMIFLAVTLGFFADNIRENIADANKEKQYARSIYDDLKVDTAVIQRTINEKAWIVLKFDSAENILTTNKVSENNEYIYYVERYISLNDVFTSQDVTYQQLRSSGNFRYINNIELYKKISDYYNLYSRYQSYDGIFGISGNGLSSEMESKIFNPRDLSHLHNDNGDNFYNLELRPASKLEPITTDELSLRLLYIKFADERRRSIDSEGLLRRLKYNATVIIKEIKDEYHLENE